MDKEEQKSTSSKPNYIVHLIYAGSFLFSVIAVIFYMHLKDEESRKEAAINEERIKAQKEERKNEYNQCIKGMMVEYQQEWAEACYIFSKKQKELLHNCMTNAYYTKKTQESINPVWAENTYKTSVSTCNLYYSHVDDGPQCSLPSSIADQIKKNNEKNPCLKDGESGPP